jgi:uncharacterized membrane protein YdjX (TVP38/TMEM64 family)
MTKKSYKNRIFALILLIALLAGIFILTPARNLLDLKSLLANKDRLLESVQGHYLPAVLIYIFLYMAVVALSIPGATAVTLTGGFLFGPFLSVLYINIGATAGATILFMAARYFFGEMIQKKYSEKLAKFNKEMEENGRNYLLTLRLIPVLPFFLVNLFPGLTNIPLRTFIWTTSLGIIPGSFAYAYLGYAGSTIQAGQGIPIQLILAMGFLGIISLIPVGLKHLKKSRSDSSHSHN